MTIAGAHSSLDVRALHQALFERLMRNSRADENDIFLAQMTASWMADRGVLPRFHGIAGTILQGDAGQALSPASVRSMACAPTGNRSHLERAPELEDLRQLLVSSRAGRLRNGEPGSSN